MKIWVAAITLLASLSTVAGATTINFEQYRNGTQITNQYASSGVTFQNAYNARIYDTNYPAHSGTGTITDFPNSPMTFTFATPVSGLSFWYSDGAGATVVLFDAAGNQLSSTGIVANAGTNALFSSALVGISEVKLVDRTADLLDVDDLSFTAGAVAVTPEPSSLALLGTGLMAITGVLRRRRSRA